MRRLIAKGFILDVVCFLVFLLLKVLNVVNWSWVWILSPLWIEGGILGLCVILCMLKYGHSETLDSFS